MSCVDLKLLEHGELHTDIWCLFLKSNSGLHIAWSCFYSQQFCDVKEPFNKQWFLPVNLFILSNEAHTQKKQKKWCPLSTSVRYFLQSLKEFQWLLFPPSKEDISLKHRHSHCVNSYAYGTDLLLLIVSLQFPVWPKRQINNVIFHPNFRQ